MIAGTLPPPRALEYLSVELALRATGQLAAALCCWSASLSLFVMSRAIDPAGAISLGTVAALGGGGLGLAAMRNELWSRAVWRGEVPPLPRSTEIAVRSRVEPAGSTALAFLLAYGFFSLWLAAAWRIAGKFPGSAYPVIVGVAAGLLVASLALLLRSRTLEHASVSLASRDPERLCADLGAALREAAASGRAEPLVSTGVLVGMGLQLLAFLALTLDPKCARITLAILGPRPLGLPWQPVFGALLFGLTAPLPIMTRELLRVLRYASTHHGHVPSRPLAMMWYVLTGYDAPDARRVRLILAGGSAYFLILLLAWIALTAGRGTSLRG